MSLDISLIRESFEEVKPIAGEAAEFFYKTLFESYPEARPLFKETNLEKQKKALINSLVTIVENIDNTQNLVPYLKKMGARHIKYGTKEDHYPMVGNTLIATFRHFFGNNWSDELEEQWLLAYGVISQYMLEGAKEALASQKMRSEIPSPFQKDDLQDLSNTVRQLARNILFKALEQETEGEFFKLAKKKASNVLSLALREESELIQEHFSGKKKVS